MAAWRYGEAARAWEHDSLLGVTEACSAVSVGECKALPENAANAPHVGFGTIDSLSQYELWGPIPA